MRCDAEAEDILQSVFLKIFTYAQEKPKSIKEIKNLKSWLIQIVVNASKMSIRAKVRQREKDMKKQSEASSFSGEKEILYQQVTKHLANLPEKYRLPVCLHYVENMSFAEISMTLNIDQPTLKVQASRGIAKLRDLLQKAGVALSATALSSILPELGFQKAPANITFQKVAALKSTRLEPLLNYSEKSTPLTAYVATAFIVSVLGLATYSLAIQKDTIAPLPIETAVKKTLHYNFENEIPEGVSLPENSSLKIAPAFRAGGNLSKLVAKGLRFPLDEKPSTITFSEASMNDRPFAITSEFINIYTQTTTSSINCENKTVKNRIFSRPFFPNRDYTRHYKSMFIDNYEIFFVQGVPVMINEIEISENLANEKLKMSYEKLTLRKVTIETLDQTTTDELRNYISSKIKAKDAVQTNLNTTDLKESKYKNIYTIPALQDLKKPLVLTINLKKAISIFDGVQIYFLDDKGSSTRKSYTKSPDDQTLYQSFNFYLFDGFCGIDSTGGAEQPLIIFETTSPTLNEIIGLRVDPSLIESIQITPTTLRKTMDFFNFVFASQKDASNRLVELKINPAE